MPLDDEVTRKKFVAEFISAIKHDSDLIAVLRGHLYTEAILTKLIASKFQGSDVVIQELDYSKKIRLARRQKLISPKDAKALEVLGNVRDSFAHMPIKDALTRDDDDRMIAVADDDLRESYQRTSTIDSVVGQPTRWVIISIFNRIGWRVVKAALEEGADSDAPLE